MAPIRGCSLGSTTRGREGPSGSGWPAQPAADAVWEVMQPSNPKHKAAHCGVRTPTNTLPTMKHRLHSRLRLRYYTGRHERRLNCLTSPPDLRFRGGTIKINPRSSRDKMHH